MRDATGQLSDGLHLHGGAQLLLELPLMGHVAGHRDYALLPLGGGEDPGGAVEPAPFAIPVLEPKGRPALASGLEPLRHLLAYPIAIVRVQKARRILQKAVGQAAEQALHVGADVDAPPVPVPLRDHVAGVLGETPVALLAGPQRRQGAP